MLNYIPRQDIDGEQFTLLPVSISALQHYSYCPRQCALIHQEQQFSDNIHTARGHAVHAVVDIPESDIAKGIPVERALPIYSRQLGLVGKADVVEFRDKVPYPVEYKHGGRRAKIHDDIQLAAQAICLEEMLSISVSRGAIYYFRSRRRREVVIDDELRTLVYQTTLAIRNIMNSEDLPTAFNDARCNECSLYEICQPKALTAQSTIKQMIDDLYNPGDKNE
ncbi:MAG: CRISPR-associated protein Cas4 [Alphaproteobacteria bacterium]|nr:CRISPR-associated protein Cas4 [Alphaproteobacteria bacterium]